MSGDWISRLNEAGAEKSNAENYWERSQEAKYLHGDANSRAFSRDQCQ